MKVLKGTELTLKDEGEEYVNPFYLDYQDGRPIVSAYLREYVEPKAFVVNDAVYNVGDIIVINEDTVITTLTDGYQRELSDIETPYKEGYVFKGWYDAEEDGEYTDFNNYYFYPSGETYYAYPYRIHLK